LSRLAVMSTNFHRFQLFVHVLPLTFICHDI